MRAEQLIELDLFKELRSSSSKNDGSSKCRRRMAIYVEKEDVTDERHLQKFYHDEILKESLKLEKFNKKRKV